VGRDQFDYLIDQGLKPEHRLLDVGCGALRAGVWLIQYLEEGNYFGVESHLESLKAAAEYEIPLHGLGDKRPRLLHDTSFRLGHFGVEFDWILCFAVLIHLDRAQVDTACREIAEVLAPDGRLILTHRLPMGAEELEARFGLGLVDHTVTHCKLVDARLEWWEFRLVEPR
jgi:SAM-dependent methyltransferase